MLAGGGARAFAHVGVLRELEDAGLHVDRVAGASVGVDRRGPPRDGHRRGDELEDVCYAEFVRRRPFSDWRLPIASLAKGRRVRDGARPHTSATPVHGGARRTSCTRSSTDLVSRTRQVHRRG